MTTAPARSRAPGAAGRPARPGFRPDIEGLRAVAVLLVVLGHAGVPLLSGGFVGVDVFFVISGYLITSLLLREQRISLVRFYARRAVRLLPASTLVAVAALAGAWLWLSPARFGEHAANALASAAYSVNLRLAAVGTDYFADQAPSPFQHFWSLAVEEQFYLLWPLLIIAVGRFRRALPVVLGLLVAGSFALGVTETARSAPWAYFGPHTRAWELGLGALVALLPRKPRRWLGWAGLAAILLAAVRYDDTTPYPGTAALLPVAGAVAIVAAGLPALGARPLQFVGRMSYGWYLWHWPLLVIGPAALGLATGVPLNLALCALALGLAVVTYHLVENPVRHRRDLTARPWRGVGLGLILSASAAALALLAALFPPALPQGARGPDTAALVDAAADPQAELRRLVAGPPPVLPVNLVPQLADAATDRTRPQTDGCHLSFEAVEPTTSCEYGRPGGARTVVLFGDSHALQWFPALAALAERNDWRLVSLTKSSCSPASVDLDLLKFKRPYAECGEWRTKVLQRIAALHPDLVVIGSSVAYRDAIRASSPDEAWRGGWTRTLTAVRAASRKVAVLADTPFLPSAPADCVAVKPLPECARPAAEVLRDPPFRSAMAAAAGPSLIETGPWLCAARCPMVVGNLLVYRDSNHLTTAYARMLSRVLENRLRALR